MERLHARARLPVKIIQWAGRDLKPFSSHLRKKVFTNITWISFHLVPGTTVQVHYFRLWVYYLLLPDLLNALRSIIDWPHSSCLKHSFWLSNILFLRFYLNTSVPILHLYVCIQSCRRTVVTGDTRNKSAIRRMDWVQIDNLDDFKTEAKPNKPFLWSSIIFFSFLDHVTDTWELWLIRLSGKTNRPLGRSK